MICEFEPHRPASLFLAYDSVVKSIPARGHIFDADRDNVTAAELTVDGEVEEYQIAFAVSEWPKLGWASEAAWDQ